MSTEFGTYPFIHFDEAIAKLKAASDRLIVESWETAPDQSPRKFLFGQHRVDSLDRKFSTLAGRTSPHWQMHPTLSDEERHRDPLAGIFFFKVAGGPRNDARKFLLTIGEILGVQIMHEWNWPIADLYDAGTRYHLGMTDEEADAILEKEEARQ